MAEKEVELKTEEEESKLPNWSSVEEVYILAVQNFEKKQFNVEELAQARIGHEASRSALQAESSSLYNMLRYASMYGLVEWLGGNEFRVTALPDDSDDSWGTTFVARALKLRRVITKKMEEKPPLVEVETIELNDKKYVIAYIGSETTGKGIDAFVYSVWDPKDHEGIALQAWSRNIRVAKDICDELTSREVETAVFQYSKVDESTYRSDRGLACNIYLKIELI